MVRSIETTTCALVLIAMTGSAGCKKGSSSAANEPFYAQTVAELRDRDVTVGELKAVDGKRYGAQACAEGEAEKLRVLLCRYTDADTAERARARLLPFVQSAVTGVVRRAGNQLLAIADAQRQDLKGEHIQRLAAAFAELEPKPSAPGGTGHAAR